MKIVCLMENTKESESVAVEHGFSLYVETAKHRILIDAGQTGAFADNASSLNVDLSKVDMVFLSHGHYDHSGGLMTFSSLNSSAPIYMQKNAGNDYFHKNETLEKYIGIDKNLLQLPQIKLLDKDTKIDDGISCFTGVTGRRSFPSGNLELMERVNLCHKETFVQDDFSHEQYVVICDEGRKVLISGCAHNGILNILDHYKKIYGEEPDIVISGFHLMKKTGYSEEDIANIKEIATELASMDTVFYTGHCTGVEPFCIMKEIMGDKLHYIHSGERIM